MTDWYYVEDLDKFLEKIREISYDKFIEINQESKDELANKFNQDLDEILSEQETSNITMPFLKTKNGKCKISEKTIIKIIEKLNSRMVSNSLNKLVSSGIIESAYDNDLNDFVFWVKK